MLNSRLNSVTQNFPIQGQFRLHNFYPRSALDFEEPISCIINPQDGKGGIYLGNILGAQNVQRLKQMDINAVLTVAGQLPVLYNKEDINDMPQQNLYQYFEQMIQFIDENRKTTNVLVHCQAGISRSSTTVIAYLMKKFGWSLEQAYNYCKQKRSLTNPNPGFRQQLQQYEYQLRNSKMESNLKESRANQEFKLLMSKTDNLINKISYVRQGLRQQNQQDINYEHQVKKNQNEIQIENHPSFLNSINDRTKDHLQNQQSRKQNNKQLQLSMSISRDVPVQSGFNMCGRSSFNGNFGNLMQPRSTFYMTQQNQFMRSSQQAF